MQYLWTFISKFVIDMITGEGDTKKLLVLMAAFTVIQMASSAFVLYILVRIISPQYSKYNTKSLKNPAKSLDFHI